MKFDKNGKRILESEKRIIIPKNSEKTRIGVMTEELKKLAGLDEKYVKTFDGGTAGLKKIKRG